MTGATFPNQIRGKYFGHNFYEATEHLVIDRESTHFHDGPSLIHWFMHSLASLQFLRLKGGSGVHWIGIELVGQIQPTSQTVFDTIQRCPQFANLKAERLNLGSFFVCEDPFI